MQLCMSCVFISDGFLYVLSWVLDSFVHYLVCSLSVSYVCRVVFRQLFVYVCYVCIRFVTQFVMHV